MSDIVITEQDNNKGIKASIGDKVIVKLTWNPSTGYYWQDSYTTAGVLEQVKHDGDSDDAPGSSHTVFFTFKITGAGNITLLHARPWNEKEPSKLFYVNVDLN